MNEDAQLVSMSYQDYLELYDPTIEHPKIIGHWERTSKPTLDYNCLAHALGIEDKWFAPEKGELGYWWPEGIERKWDLPTIRKLLASYGFTLKSKTRGLTEGFVKIAIYTDKKRFTLHFARQLETGGWTSKLGDKLDLRHDNLECMEGGSYGRVREIVMKRIK